MELLPFVVIGILVLLVLVLLARTGLIRKSAREIAEAFHDRLTTNTNALIDISSRDRCMLKLASDINGQLRLLHLSCAQTLTAKSSDSSR